MNRLAAKLGKISLKNPVAVASGTFGKEYQQFFDISALGAVVTKTITMFPKAGNKPPRLIETPSGLINSIGLQNPGINGFCRDVLPDYVKITGNKTNLIVSFSGSTIKEFLEIAERLEHEEGIDGYEVNISCPNVEKEGLSFGVDATGVFELTSKLRQTIKSDRELIVKLTPNVTDITKIATAAYEGGCDSLALINTLIGMKVDWQTGKPLVGRGFGGLSGPAIMPAALYNVYLVARKVNVPILAMGGISSYRDALEFISVGAAVVAIGTANFINPLTTLDIIKGLDNYCNENKLTINEIMGRTKNFLP